MKASKHRRKALNRARQLGEIPWPARKYRIAPTFSGDADKKILVGHCKRKVAEQQIETKTRFRRKKTETVEIPCGGNVYVKRGSLGKRRAYCEDCRARAAQRKLALRFQKRAARLSPKEQAVEQRKEVSRLRRFTRRGG